MPLSRFALLLLFASCSDPDPIGPQLEVRTPVLAFGTVPCGTTAAHTVTLGNSGDQPLEVTLTSSLVTVEVAPASATIDPGQEIDFAVTARAALAPGATSIVSTGELAITGGPSISISFVPSGLSIVFPVDPIDFGDVSQVNTAVRGFSIFATGTGVATVAVRTPSLFTLTTPATFVVLPGSEGRVLIELRGQSFPATLADDLTLAFAGDICSSDRGTVKLRGRLVP